MAHHPFVERATMAAAATAFPSTNTQINYDDVVGTDPDCDRDLARMVLEQANAIQESKVRMKKAERDDMREAPLSLADDLSTDGSECSIVHDAAHEKSEDKSKDETIRMLKEALQSSKQALLSVQENASIKQRKLELEVTLLRRALSDANARMSKMVVLNQSLQTLAKAALKNPDHEPLRKQEFETERQFEKVLAARKQACDENYILKRLLLQTCDGCRAKLPVRKNPLRNNQVAHGDDNTGHATSTADAPSRSLAPVSPDGMARKLTYQNAAQKLVRSMSTPERPVRGMDARVVKSLPSPSAVPKRGILKTNSTDSSKSACALSAVGLSTAPTSASTSPSSSRLKLSDSSSRFSFRSLRHSPSSGSLPSAKSLPVRCSSFNSSQPRDDDVSVRSCASGTSSMKSDAVFRYSSASCKTGRKQKDTSPDNATQAVDDFPDQGPRKVYPKEGVYGEVAPGTRHPHINRSPIGMQIDAPPDKEPDNGHGTEDEASDDGLQREKRRSWRKRMLGGWKGKGTRNDPWRSDLSKERTLTRFPSS